MDAPQRFMIVLFSCSCFYLILAKQAHLENDWKIDRIECRASVCSPITCNLTRLSRKTQLINFGCNVTRSLSSLHAQITLYYRFHYYRPFLLDINANICDYLGPKKLNQPIMTVMGPYVTSHSNFIHSCPLFEDLWVRGLRVNQNLLAGSMLPKGQYRANVRALEKPKTNQTLFEAEIYFSVSNGKSTVDMEMG